MIQRLDLENFKGFSNFTVTFGPQTVLVGPNNAGKSTINAALRASSRMLRIARSRVADGRVATPVGTATAWVYDASRIGLATENLRHEFRAAPTSLTLRFRGGASLYATWPIANDPDDGDPDPAFVLRAADGVVVRRPSEVRRAFPLMSVIPGLSPVEQNEPVLSDDHVQANMTTRLTSRHFRNQLRILQETVHDDGSTDLERFLEWAREWTPDFVVGETTARMVERGRELDLFCTEAASRVSKELAWAGDGIQVWMQLLSHVWQARDSATIVLDEPDLYLHADLQRRLVRLLDSLDVQTIAASHSAELLGEAAPSAVTWVDRSRRRAVRAPDDRILTELSDSIGSRFNLRLARTLRARGVLFVEGQDVRILRNLGKTLGLPRLAADDDLAVVALEGFSNWVRIEPFTWLVRDLLENAVPIYVVLDSDYRTTSQIQVVRDQLSTIGVESHFWRRKEIESYLLEAPAISRLSGADVAGVEQMLEQVADDLRGEVSARRLIMRMDAEVSATKNRVDVAEDHDVEFDALWADATRRHHWCNAKHVVSGLNTALATAGYRTVNARRLSTALGADEIADEMREVLHDVEVLGR